MNALTHDLEAQLRAGAVVGAAYVVEGVIGHGATSIVYRARPIAGGPPIALKILCTAFARGGIAARRFEREAALVARLDHPSVVRLLASGWLSNGQPWLALELLHGETLEALLAREAPLDRGRAIRLLSEALAGLAAAHAADVVHRDLKPANLFVARGSEGEEHAKLLDFGVGRDLRDLGPRLTGPSCLVGTLRYLAPEQLTPGMDADARADLWAIGVVGYRALTGTSPFGVRGARIVQAILEREPPPPSAAVPGLGPRVDAFFARALAKDRDRRFPSAHAMREALLALV